MTLKKTMLYRGLIAATLLAGAAPPVHASHVGEELALDDQTVATTNQLLQTLRSYERTPGNQRAALADELTRLAALRRDQMLVLIDRSPAVAALRVLPQSVRARLPAAAQALVEKPVVLRGTLGAAVEDDFARGRSKTRAHLVDEASQRPFAVRAAGVSEREQLRWVGRRGAISGVQLDGHVLVTDRRQVQLQAAGGATATGGSGTLAAAQAVQGVQNALVVLLNFSDKALECAATDVQTRLFGTTGATMNVGYQQSSGNLVAFTGRVVGPYNIAYSSAGSCDYNGWTSAAKAALAAAGVSTSGYNRISYVTPANSTCGWSGLATLGGTVPTPSWIQACSSTGVFSHELGHNLLLHHAATPTSEYGDYSDPMGGAMLVQFNAANRVMAGWMGAGAVQDVVSGGNFVVSALNATAPANPQVLRFPKADTGETYYVSMRQANGIDSNLLSSMRNSVTVHRATGTLPAKTFLLANLAAGQTWTDSANGIQVTHQGVTGDTAFVGISKGGSTPPACTTAAPSVAVAPAAQGSTPGAALAYGLTVTNNDSSSCSASIVNLSQTLPTGFTGTFSPSTLTLPPGASAAATWTVASPGSASDSTYTLTATAAASLSAKSAQGHASLTVTAPPPPPPPPPPTDTTPPSLTITSPAPSASLPASLRVVSLAANASDPSGVASVSFYVDGKLLATDASAPYTANWNTRKASTGAHTIRVVAVDALGNTAEKSISVTLVK